MQNCGTLSFEDKWPISVKVTIRLGSVVDPDPEPDPKGSEPFCRIWIRKMGLDPDPEPKGSKYKL